MTELVKFAKIPKIYVKTDYAIGQNVNDFVSCMPIASCLEANRGVRCEFCGVYNCIKQQNKLFVHKQQRIFSNSNQYKLNKK